MNRLWPITTALVSSVSLAWAGEEAGRGVAPQASIAAPNPIWTGFYIGGTLGIAALDDRVTHVDDPILHCWWDCDSLRGLKDASHGAIGGLQVGYNWQLESLVLGLEADISAASNSGEFDTFCTDGACDYQQRSRMLAIGTVRGRLGYALDRSLFYVTAGWVKAEMRNHVNDFDNEAVWDARNWRAGWTAGGGLEYAITEVWSIKAEALYYDLKDETVTFDYGGGYLFTAKFKDDGVIGRVGLNLRLGAPAEPLPARY
jgi:outer membrane immunogenic protein